ncbi:MAG TPA: ATP-binding protein [Polyangiaceae bacterium]|jgi:PAS domain S-box-containing protein
MPTGETLSASEHEDDGKSRSDLAAAISVFRRKVEELEKRNNVLEAARKEAERAEELWRDFIDQAPVVVAILDREHNCVMLSRSRAGEPGENLGTSWLDRLTEDSAARAVAAIEHVLNTGQPVEYEVQTRPVPGDEQRWYATRAGPLWENGKVNRAIAVATDVTGRRVARQRLMEEARLRLIIQQIPGILWTTDKEHRLTSAVGNALERSGMRSGAIHGINIGQYFEVNDPQRAAVLQAHQQAVAGKSTRFELEMSAEVYDVRIEPLYDAQGIIVGAIGMAVKITDRKKLDAQVRSAQRLEALGRLAGGVAHDFNNLLTIIGGHAALALARTGDDTVRSYVEPIQKATERGAALTRQLLTFGSRQLVAPALVDLNELVRNMAKLLSLVIGDEIELKLDAAAQCVRADPGQLEQVVTNLVLNGRDAMPSGGSIRVQTGMISLEGELECRSLALPPGSYVKLAVSDTGVGMGTETQARAFEPFFTTKQPGKGTGLGLSTVYGIVRGSGGAIGIHSALGRGTTVSIYLPAAEGQAPALRTPAPSEPVVRGTETVLLVEDDDLVRIFAERALTEAGYSTISARDGAEALQLCESSPRQIDLLLTDVAIPKLNGFELASRVIELRPGIKVVCMSAHGKRALTLRDAPAEPVILLEKPFTPALLARTLRQALDAR